MKVQIANSLVEKFREELFNLIGEDIINSEMEGDFHTTIDLRTSSEEEENHIELLVVTMMES